MVVLVVCSSLMVPHTRGLWDAVSCWGWDVAVWLGVRRCGAIRGERSAGGVAGVQRLAWGVSGGLVAFTAACCLCFYSFLYLEYDFYNKYIKPQYVVLLL